MYHHATSRGLVAQTKPSPASPIIEVSLNTLQINTLHPIPKATLAISQKVWYTTDMPKDPVTGWGRNPDPPRKPYEDTAIKHQAYAVLREAGFMQKDVGKVLGYSPASLPTLTRSLEKKRKSILATLTPHAKRAVKQIIQGKAVGDTDAPRASDVLRAAEIVLDRVDPKINITESTNITASFTEIALSDLSDYTPESASAINIPSQPIDITEDLPIIDGDDKT